MKYTNVCQDRGQLLIREIDDSGRRISRREKKFSPVLFTSKKSKGDEGGYTDLFGNPVYKVSFDSFWDMKKRIKEKSYDKELWGDDSIISQYIERTYKDMDNSPDDIWVSYLDIEVLTRLPDENGTMIDHGFPEASEAKYPINAICQYNSWDKKYHVYSLASWNKEKSQLKYRDEVEFHYFDDEKELIKEWYKVWCRECPDILSGWNVKTFDVPYIVNRMIRLFSLDSIKYLSPWKIVEPKTVRGKYGDLNVYDIKGVAILDYMDLYQKHRKVPRKKHTLAYIAEMELDQDEQKLTFKGSHGSLFYDDPQFFIDYNIQDVMCVKTFEELLGYIQLSISMAYYTGINFEDTYSPIQSWETLIFRECQKEKICTPLRKPPAEKTKKYEGAYVHDPIPGLKKNIASFDFTSLYPTIMRQWSIGRDVVVPEEKRDVLFSSLKKRLRDSGRPEDTDFLNEISLTESFSDYYTDHDLPETVQEFLKDNGITMSVNCQMYDISKESIFVRLITKLFTERKSDKKKSQEYKQLAKENKDNHDLWLKYYHLHKKYDISQNVKKVMLNSLYGAIGSPFCRYYMTAMAMSITLTGQCMINKSARATNIFLNNKSGTSEDYRIYSDTDSNYFDITAPLEIWKKDHPNATRKELVDYADVLCREIETDCLKPLFDRVHSELNCRKECNVLNMDREVISIASPSGYAGLWTAKKRYCVLVDDNEGYRYDTPHQKSIGLVYMTSTVPDSCEKHLKKVTRMIIEEGEKSVRAYEKEFRKEFFQRSVEEISFPKTVSDVTKFTGRDGLPHSGFWTDVTGKTRNGGVPLHVRASIYHNLIVRSLGLETKYQLIRNGDKILYTFLKDPGRKDPRVPVDIFGTPILMDVIAYKEDLPKEFGLHGFVDYQTHYEKSFLKPLEDILTACSFSLEEKRDISIFF